MAELFARHMNAELAGDLETTLATMSDNPHLINVPSMVGGTGREGVRAFYANHLVGKFFPPDVEFTEVSRTFGDTRLIDELIISFTHTQEIEWMVTHLAQPVQRSLTGDHPAALSPAPLRSGDAYPSRV
jgi:carboxymethylenebutenolidase